MRDKVFKVKRKHIQWNEVRLELGDPAVDASYYLLKTKRPNMSDNRCAWNALKKHYSTTALTRYRFLGVPLNEPLQ